MALRTSLPVQPHLYIGDALGKPLDYGMVYFGEPDKDPEFYPIDLYLDEALTIPLSQPVRTKGGFLNANGDMIEVYAAETSYSVKVVDAHGYKVFYKPEMGSTNTDNSVSTKLSAPNSIVRTQANKNAEVVSIEDFGAKTTAIAAVNTDAINNAITHCRANDVDLYFPSKDYAVSGNLSGLHEVNTVGGGTISRGGKKWYITPSGSETNLLYVSPFGSSGNDGIDPSQPTTIANVNKIARFSIGAKSSDGFWGLRMLNGTYTEDGVRLTDWPIFKNPFQWWGEDSAATEDIEPKAIWQGNTSNSEVYAVLAQNISTLLAIDFRYISFRDWVGRTAGETTASAGAIVLWNPGQYHVEKCWFINTPFGFTHRYSPCRIINNRFENNNTAVANGYQATSYVGNLADGGNKFINCNSGAAVGRTSIMYIQKNTFDGCGNDIECTRLSRFRPQGNTHKNWGNCVYLLHAGAVLTPDNSQGYPDKFLTPVTRDKPIFFGDAGSFHSQAHSGPVSVVNNYSNKTHVLPTGISSDVMLSTQFGDAKYMPFRIPAWVLFSDTFKLTLELGMVVEAGSAGTIKLTGSGSAASSILASLTLPTVSSYTFAKVLIEVLPFGDNQVQSFITIPALNYSSRNIINISSSMAEGKDEIVIYRMYATSTGTKPITFNSLRAYVEL